MFNQIADTEAFNRMVGAVGYKYSTVTKFSEVLIFQTFGANGVSLAKLGARYMGGSTWGACLPHFIF